MKGIELRIDMRRAMAIWKRAPHMTEYYVSDAFDHIRRKFFRVWPQATDLNSSGRKWSMIWRFQGYVNRRPPSLPALNMHVVSYSGFAKMQEEGGVITGLKGRLRIPMDSAKLPSGRTKKYWRWWPPEQRKMLGDEDNLVPIVNSSGRTILAQKLRRGPNKGHIRPLFVLVDQISLRPRLRFIATWKGMQGFAVKRVDQALQKTVRQLKRGPLAKLPRRTVAQLVRAVGA
jgi:hypothetical protein